MLESAHVQELHENLSKKLKDSQRQDLGRLDSLGAAILSMVVSELYERAREEVVAYVDLKSSFPLFQERVRRYVQHCLELIHAIETKRNFPGLGTLSMAKQQEIHEKVLQHFEELKSHLKQIERVEREAKLTDVRSTVWVVKTFAIGMFAVFATAFLKDLHAGHFNTIWNVSDGYIEQSVAWLFQRFNL